MYRNLITTGVVVAFITAMTAVAVDPLSGGDPDCSQSVDVGDLTYMVAYLFQGGSAPCPITGAGGGSVTDSVWYTANYWGIARGNCGNKLWGDSVHTMVNLGVACTTGVSGSTDLEYSTISGGYHNVCDYAGNTISGGSHNHVYEMYGVIGGGIFNQAFGGATVAGGSENRATNMSAVGGGGINTADGFSSAIFGGMNNHTLGNYSVIGGGRYGWATGHFSGICSGLDNLAGQFVDDSGVFIGGGMRNLCSGKGASIGGGIEDTCNGPYATISGGARNEIASEWGGLPVVAVGAFIGGGRDNIICAPFGTISGGQENRIGEPYDGQYGTVGGGYSNTASGDSSTVSGGTDNCAIKTNGTVGGGARNSVCGNASTIGGGVDNACYGVRSVIGGGIGSLISGGYATIAGGSGNTCNGDYTAIGGGANNTTNTDFSWIGGGQNNTAKGLGASIPGGMDNTAAGDYSLACGRSAKANHAGSFVWADAGGGEVESTGENQFMIRASGGVRVFSNELQSAGVTIHPGASAWAVNSDRNLKENLVEVDGQEILDKIESLPIMEWNYKAQDDDIKHIGPVAQDFHATFGVGDDNVTISTIDPSGVALAGVKGLVAENRNLRERVEHLESLVHKLIATQADSDNEQAAESP